MLFHQLLRTVMDLGEINRQRKERQTGTPRSHYESLDVLDVSYEDVLEYYRCSNSNEEHN